MPSTILCGSKSPAVNGCSLVHIPYGSQFFPNAYDSTRSRLALCASTKTTATSSPNSCSSLTVDGTAVEMHVGQVVPQYSRTTGRPLRSASDFTPSLFTDGSRNAYEDSSPRTG